jgi:diguanylate cyclase
VRSSTTPRAAHDGTRRVWGLVVAMAAVGALATASQVPTSWPPGDWATALAVAAGFAAAERFVVAIHLSDRTQSMTLSELPLMAGLFLLDPMTLILARTVGILPSLVVSRRLPSYKVAFNVVLQWLETLAALAVVALVSPGGTGPADAALTALLVPLATCALASVGVVAARSTLDGRWHRGQALQVIAQSLGPSIATSGFAIVSFDLAAHSPWLLWAPAVTLLVLYGAYRTHARLLHATEAQARLLAFTRRTTGREGLAVAAAEIAETAAALAGVRAAGISARAGDPDDATRRWLARSGDAARLAGGAGGSTLHTWRLDDDGELVLVVDLGGAADAADLVRTLDQIANHARVVVANAAHAEALERQAREAAERALVDPLTGLPNRTALLAGMESAIAAGTPFATVLLDLDDFKQINDALGHAAGDKVLQQVGGRMTGLTESVRMLARLGGDEFAVLVDGGQATAREVADRLLELIRRPVDVPPYSLEVDASAGIAVHPAHGSDRHELLRNADLAMYEAKGSRSGTAVFGVAAAGRAVRQLAVSTSFRTALGTDQLHLAFQPVVHLASGQLVGAEALARWTHPDLGAVPPEEFIRVAEQAGLLPQLTGWVLDEALRQQRVWAQAGVDISVAVNLSPQGLLDAELPPLVARTLDRHGVAADRLTLEITEGSVIGDPHRTMAVLRRLSRLGVRLAVDDFGTGYSSLAYLRQLPVDEIKVDKSFVLPIGSDPSAVRLVNGIIRLCHELRFSVVAEGIESARVEGVLRDLGCEAGQGFSIARPMPADDLLVWALQRQGRWEVPGAGLSLVAPADPPGPATPTTTR